MRLARTAVLTHMNGLQSEHVNVDLLTGALVGKHGVFVSIFSDTISKGSIGNVLPILPLREAVMENARSAAFRDQRLSLLTRDEMNSSVTEISMLTGTIAISDPADKIVDTDGVILEKGCRQAVLLPQTASKNGWDASAVLMRLSSPVGLGSYDWSSDDSFETFHAESFCGMECSEEG